MSVESLFSIDNRPKFTVGLEEHLRFTSKEDWTEEEAEAARYYDAKIGDGDDCDMTEAELVEDMVESAKAIESYMIALEFMERFDLSLEKEGPSSIQENATGDKQANPKDPAEGEKSNWRKIAEVKDQILDFLKKIIDAIKHYVVWIGQFVKKIFTFLTNKKKYLADKANKTLEDYQKNTTTVNIANVSPQVRKLNGDPVAILKNFITKTNTVVGELKKHEDSLNGINFDVDEAGTLVANEKVAQVAEALNTFMEDNNNGIQSVGPEKLKEALYANNVAPVETPMGNYFYNTPETLVGACQENSDLYKIIEEVKTEADKCGQYANIFVKAVHKATQTIANVLNKLTKQPDQSTNQFVKTFRQISQCYTKLGGCYSAIATEACNIIGDIEKMINELVKEINRVVAENQQKAAQANANQTIGKQVAATAQATAHGNAAINGL